MTKEGSRKSLVELIKGPGIRFGVVGSLLTLLDLALYQLMANVFAISFFGLPSGVCAVWGVTPIIILINFFISHRFVWKSTASKRKTVVPFFGLNLTTGLVVQPLVISFALWVVWTTGFTGLDSGIINILAKCLAVGVGMVLNFLGAKYLFE